MLQAAPPPPLTSARVSKAIATRQRATTDQLSAQLASFTNKSFVHCGSCFSTWDRAGMQEQGVGVGGSVDGGQVKPRWHLPTAAGRRASQDDATQPGRSLDGGAGRCDDDCG